MLSLDKLPTNTKKLFLTLAANNQDGILDDFLMIGGTALAMQIQHRVSEDIDFAVGTLKLPKQTIETLITRLEAAGMEVINATSEAARDEFDNDGLDVEDYHQDWLVDGTKLTFFTYGNNAHESKIIGESPFESFHSIRVASLDTIAKTKCHALTRRMKSRDLFDICHLIGSGHLSIADVIAEMQKSDRHMTFETCVNRLLEKPLQADDEGLMPIGVEIPLGDIRAALAQQVEDLEEDIAAALIQRYRAASPAENGTYIGLIEDALNGLFIQSLGRGEYVAHQEERVGALEVGTTYTIGYSGLHQAVSVVPAPKKEKAQQSR